MLYDTPTLKYLALSLLTKLKRLLKAESNEGINIQADTTKDEDNLGIGICRKREVPAE